MRRLVRMYVAAVVVAALGPATIAAAAADGEARRGRDSDGPGPAGRTMELQVLGLNDFHGRLESGGSLAGVEAGGAEYLSTHLDRLRSGVKYSTTVAAGDLIGATPLISAAFYDEPTIEALSAMGLSAASVGNHEFDAGWRELLRKQDGGCLDDGDGENNRNSCPDESAPFAGASFDYLSANVFHTGTDDTLLPPYTIQRFGPAKVAFIGMTLEATPTIVTRSGVEGLDFTDEVETANALVPELRAAGVRSIVVLLHEGGFPADPDQYNACPGISGPVVDIAERLDPEIDAVISGHTHQGYNCVIDDPAGQPRSVTSASSYGRLITDLRLTIDRRTKDVRREHTRATNVIVDRDQPADPAMTVLVDKYSGYVEPIASREIGHLTEPLVTRDQDDSHESALGNLIADAMLVDPSVVAEGVAPEVALMNPGGIRADLEGVGADYAVTFGNAFTVQPFSNYLVSMDLTGAQLLTLLHEQWSGVNAGGEDRWRVLQVAGMIYSWTPTADGAQVVDGSVLIGGEPLDESATYRVVTNSFLADGGDGFATFPEATNTYFGGLDIDALSAYLAEHDPYAPTATDRITVE